MSKSKCHKAKNIYILGLKYNGSEDYVGCSVCQAPKKPLTQVVKDFLKVIHLRTKALALYFT